MLSTLSTPSRHRRRRVSTSTHIDAAPLSSRVVPTRHRLSTRIDADACRRSPLSSRGVPTRDPQSTHGDPVAVVAQQDRFFGLGRGGHDVSVSGLGSRQCNVGDL